jgi:hypothetical protein
MVAPVLEFRLPNFQLGRHQLGSLPPAHREYQLEHRPAMVAWVSCLAVCFKKLWELCLYRYLYWSMATFLASVYTSRNQRQF